MSKWFYPLQKKAEAMIDAKYERMSYCNWQEVTEDRVIENWTVKKPNGDIVTIVVVLQKRNIGIYENVVIRGV